MRVVTTMGESRRATGSAPDGTVVGLVPTMGFFHEGHLSLMERARQECDLVVVSLFVNPLQFDEPGDLARYPTDHGRDLQLAEEEGVDIVVMPSGDEMFSVEPLTRVSVSLIGEGLEAAHRPGHLEGVATVVTKLFAGLQPDRAYFGRKDAQQLAMVTRLAIDLSLPVQVVGCPLIRERDGLALSSRNVFLGDDRTAALGLSRGLFAAADLAEAGERAAAALEAAVRGGAPGVDLEYAALVDADRFEPIETVERAAVLAVAGRVGSLRLIDNVRIDVEGERLAVDRGRRIDGPSLLEGAMTMEGG